MPTSLVHLLKRKKMSETTLRFLHTPSWKRTNTASIIVRICWSIISEGNNSRTSWNGKYACTVHYPLPRVKRILNVPFLTNPCLILRATCLPFSTDSYWAHKTAFFIVYFA
jgi:hypothetical protein